MTSRVWLVAIAGCGRVAFDPVVDARSGDSTAFDVTAGLVHRWRFDDGAGTVAADSGTSPSDGQVHGATWTSGRIGGALAFDGTSAYVGVPALGPGDLTVTGWLYLSGDGPSGADDFLWEGTAGAVTRFWCTRESFNGSRMFCGDDSNVLCATADAIPLGAWKFFSAARTSSGTFTLYLDGIESGAAGCNGSPTSSDGTNSDIGSHSTGAGSMVGSIDDVRVYDRVLSAAEIAQIYAAAP